MYQHGRKLPGPLFAAFALPVPRENEEGPRLGFTIPRTFGKAVKRNRVKRRIREMLRLRLTRLDRRWDLVINPKRLVLDARPEELEREIERLLSRCKQL